jgi:hypothetical protein
MDTHGEPNPELVRYSSRKREEKGKTARKRTEDWNRTRIG